MPPNHICWFQQLPSCSQKQAAHLSVNNTYSKASVSAKERQKREQDCRLGQTGSDSTNVSSSGVSHNCEKDNWRMCTNQDEKKWRRRHICKGWSYVSKAKGREAHAIVNNINLSRIWNQNYQMGQVHSISKKEEDKILKSLFDQWKSRRSFKEQISEARDSSMTKTKSCTTSIYKDSWEIPYQPTDKEVTNVFKNWTNSRLRGNN